MGGGQEKAVEMSLCIVMMEGQRQQGVSRHLQERQTREGLNHHQNQKGQQESHPHQVKGNQAIPLLEKRGHPREDPDHREKGSRVNRHQEEKEHQEKLHQIETAALHHQETDHYNKGQYLPSVEEMVVHHPEKRGQQRLHHSPERVNPHQEETDRLAEDLCRL